MATGGIARPDRRAALAWFAMAALPAFLVAAFAPPVLGDGDTLWHVAAGNWIIDHGRVPMVDPFSFSFAGQPWHVHEWLAEVLYALAWRAFGWAGVAALAGLMVALAAGLLHAFLRARISPVAALLALVLSFACLAPGMLARPHLMSLPLLVGWSWLLLNARAADRAPAPGWLLLIPLWANIHGSALFAAALAGFFAAEALVTRPADWRRTLRLWTPFVAGALLGLLATPRGLEGVIFLVELTRMKSLGLVVEWQPLDLARLSAAQVLFWAGLGSLLWWRVRLPWTRLALLALLVVMTLQHQRHQALLATVGTMVWAQAVACSRRAAPLPSLRAWLAPAATALLAAALVLRLALPTAPRESNGYPRTALAHIPADLRGLPVLNGYNSGGALIAGGIRPFIDGRTDLYGDAFNALAHGAEHGAPGVLEQVLAQWPIAWTFLPTESRAVAQLDRAPGWQRIYADRLIVMHRRMAAR